MLFFLFISFDTQDHYCHAKCPTLTTIATKEKKLMVWVSKCEILPQRAEKVTRFKFVKFRKKASQKCHKTIKQSGHWILHFLRNSPCCHAKLSTNIILFLTTIFTLNQRYYQGFIMQKTIRK